MIHPFQSLTTHIKLPCRNAWREEYIYREREESLNVEHRRDVPRHPCSKSLIQLRPKDMNHIRLEILYYFLELFLIIRPKHLVPPYIMYLPQVDNLVLARLGMIGHRIIGHSFLHHLFRFTIFTERNAQRNILAFHDFFLHGSDPSTSVISPVGGMVRNI